MIKYKYDVSGIFCFTGESFKAECVALNIIQAIKLFQNEGYNVHKIERKEQVHKDAPIKILSLERKV